MPQILRPGLRLVIRGPGTMTLMDTASWLGIGSVAGVALPDTPAVRRLVADLADGRASSLGDAVTRGALSRIVTAGLTESTTAMAARHSARAAARVVVDAPPGLGSPAVELLMASGLTVTTRDDAATHVLVAACTEVDRRRLDDWVRRGVAHLLVVDRGSSVTVGPFVVPGRTACVHCLDAHLAETDPDLPALVPAVADAPTLGSAPSCDAALRATALGWAVRDLVSAVEGGRPSTWSATVTLGVGDGAGLSAAHREWRRHLHCGCAWADELAG